MARQHLRAQFARLFRGQMPRSMASASAGFFGASALMFSVAGWRRANGATGAPDLAFCAEVKEAKTSCGVFVAGLPEYTAEQVAEHVNIKGPNPSVWVIYKAGVYDITEFVMKHPGGDKRIMLAAGGSVEKFWQLYTQHDDDAVRTILERYRVGNLKGYVERKPSPEEQAAIWAKEPKRAKGIVVHNQRPFNAETPEPMLEQFLTPNDLFYVRNHMPVPEIDAKNFCLLIDGEGISQHCFTIDQLRTLFPEHTVTTTIQCGGNRRSEMATKLGVGGGDKPVKGLSWAGGAIGTAKWTGVRLGDVIRYCQASHGRTVDRDVSRFHVHLFGADQDVAGQFSVSVPYHKATAPEEDTIIAYRMNDEPLPRDHGYPLRAVVPGTVGVRNCKWLSRVSVQPEEAQTVWQQQDYKNFPSWATAPDPSLPSVMAMPVQSYVVSAEHDTSNDVIRVKGYAYCGGGTPIQRVDLSVDGGKTFRGAANLLEPSPAEEPQQLLPRAERKYWAWRLFEAEVEVTEALQKASVNDKGKFVVCSRAVTADNHQQPPLPNYNFRGLLNNSVACREAEVK